MQSIIPQLQNGEPDILGKGDVVEDEGLCGGLDGVNKFIEHVKALRGEQHITLIHAEAVSKF